VNADFYLIKNTTVKLYLDIRSLTKLDYHSSNGPSILCKYICDGEGPDVASFLENNHGNYENNEILLIVMSRESGKGFNLTLTFLDTEDGFLEFNQMYLGLKMWQRRLSSFKYESEIKM